MQKSIIKRLYEHRLLYVLLVPALLYFAVFCYVPLYGIILAFKEFNFRLGILNSPWVGFGNFQTLFHLPDFKRAFVNTILISLGRLVFEFPAPIILALLLNEVASTKLKRWMQTVFTFPHFLSWVVISGVLVNMFGDGGVINQALVAFGLDKTDVLVNASTYKAFLFISNVWKEIGWGAIIYLAAIAGVSPDLYEAAYVDGANRFHRILYVTWPGIRSTIAIMFILAIGGIMNGGFDQVFNLYNPPVYETADILDTFIFRYSIQSGNSFGIATAVGLLKSIIAFAMLWGANYSVRKFGEQGLL
ncbi:ABC transporter permease subunit [Paenibacillus sp. FSL R10-2734]|uniref:ABC transporter permease n=1 Tax=Paenibacillus sp. FSL R10-2734 TaxID=2954691 RepID=UPI0030DBD943